jgi:uncharacterized protein with HEPN domain
VTTLDRTPALLADMLAFVRELRELLEALPLADMLRNRLLMLATEKLFINLGEAANRIAPEHRAQMGDIPWRLLIAARNVIAHGYEQIDHRALHATVQRDLPALQQALERHLTNPRKPGP